MAIEWKDITTYSRGETDRTPRTWQATAGDIRITVSRHIYYDSDTWVIRTPFGERPALSTDIDAAKAEALGIARRMLVEAVEALGEEQKA